MKPFYYSMDILHNSTGTYFSTLEKKYMITTYDDNPIIVYFDNEHKNNENNMQYSDKLHKSKSKYEEKMENFRKMSHVAWVNGIPFLLASLNNGMKLRFDALLEQKIGYQSILLWTGTKPKSCPVLRANEILFVQEYVNLSIHNITFDAESTFIHIEVDDYVRQLPFACGLVYSYESHTEFNEELKKTCSCGIPRKLVANLSKFISLDGQYLYFCQSVSMVHFNDKISSEFCCSKVYENNLLNLRPIENPSIIYYDVEFELNIIDDKNFINFVVDHINFNLQCNFGITEPSCGKAHLLYLRNSNKESFCHLLVLEMNTKEQYKYFPFLITVAISETFEPDSCHSKNVHKLVSVKDPIVDINVYIKFINAKSFSTKKLTNKSIQESEILQDFICEDAFSSIKREEFEFFVTKAFITNIEETCFELKTAVGVPYIKEGCGSEEWNQSNMNCCEENSVALPVNEFKASFCCKKNESLNLSTEKAKEVEKVNENGSYLKDTTDDIDEGKLMNSIKCVTKIDILNQESIDSKFQFEFFENEPCAKDYSVSDLKLDQNEYLNSEKIPCLLSSSINNCNSVLENKSLKDITVETHRYMECKEKNMQINIECAVKPSYQEHNKESCINASTSEKLCNIFKENEWPYYQQKLLIISEVSAIIESLKVGQYSTIKYLSPENINLLRSQQNHRLFNGGNSLPQYLWKQTGRLIYCDALKISVIFCELFGHYLILLPKSYTLYYQKGSYSISNNSQVCTGNEVYFDAVFDSVKPSYVTVTVYDKSDDVFLLGCKDIVLNGCSYYYYVQGICKGSINRHFRIDIIVNDETFQIAATLGSTCRLPSYIETFPLNNCFNVLLQFHLKKVLSTNEWIILFITPMQSSLSEAGNFRRNELLMSTKFVSLVFNISGNFPFKKSYLLRNYKAIVSEKSECYVTLMIELPNGIKFPGKIFKNYTIFDKSWVPASLLPLSSYVYFDGIMSHEISFLLIWKSLKPDKKTELSVTNYFSVPGMVVSTINDSIAIDLFVKPLSEDHGIIDSSYRTKVYDPHGMPTTKIMPNDVILAYITKCRKKGFFISVLYQLPISDANKYLHLFSTFATNNKVNNLNMLFAEDYLDEVTFEASEVSKKADIKITQFETSEADDKSDFLKSSGINISNESNKSKSLQPVVIESNKAINVSKFYMPCICRAQGSHFILLTAKHSFIIVLNQDFCGRTCNLKEFPSLKLDNKQVSAFVVELEHPFFIEKICITHRALVAWQGKKSKCGVNVDEVFISRYQIYILHSISIMTQVESEIKSDNSFVNHIFFKENYHQPKLTKEILKASTSKSSIALHEVICSNNSLVPQSNNLKQALYVHSYKTPKGKAKSINIYGITGIVVHLSDHEGILSISENDDSTIKYSYFQKKVCFINGENLVNKSNSEFRKCIKTFNTLAAEVYKCQIKDHFGYEISYSVTILYNSRKPKNNLTNFSFLKEPAHNYTNVDSCKKYSILKESVSAKQTTGPTSMLHLPNRSIGSLSSEKHQVLSESDCQIDGSSNNFAMELNISNNHKILKNNRKKYQELDTEWNDENKQQVCCLASDKNDEHCQQRNLSKKFTNGSKLSHIFSELNLGKISLVELLNLEDFVLLQKYMIEIMQERSQKFPYYIKKGCGKLIFCANLSFSIILSKLLGHWICLYIHSSTLYYYKGILSMSQNFLISSGTEIYFDATFHDGKYLYISNLVFDSEPPSYEIFLLGSYYYFNIEGEIKKDNNNQVTANVYKYEISLQISHILNEQQAKSLPINIPYKFYFTLKHGPTYDWSILYMSPFEASISSMEIGSLHTNLVQKNEMKSNVLKIDGDKLLIAIQPKKGLKFPYLLNDYIATISEVGTHVTLTITLPNGVKLLQNVFRSCLVFNDESWVKASLLSKHSVIYFDGIVNLDKISFLLMWINVKPDHISDSLLTRYFGVPGKIVAANRKAIKINLYFKSQMYLTVKIKKVDASISIFDSQGRSYINLRVLDLVQVYLEKNGEKYVVNVIRLLSSTEAKLYDNIFPVIHDLNEPKLVDKTNHATKMTKVPKSKKTNHAFQMTNFPKSKKIENLFYKNALSDQVSRKANDNQVLLNALKVVPPSKESCDYVNPHNFHLSCTPICSFMGSSFCVINAKNQLTLLLKDDFIGSDFSILETPNITKMTIGAFVVSLLKPICIQQIVITHRALVAWQGKKNKLFDMLFSSCYHNFMKNSQSVMHVIEAMVKDYKVLNYSLINAQSCFTDGKDIDQKKRKKKKSSKKKKNCNSSSFIL